MYRSDVVSKSKAADDGDRESVATFSSTNRFEYRCRHVQGGNKPPARQDLKYSPRGASLTGFSTCNRGECRAPKRPEDIYATTFGTRCRSCSEDKGITIVNVYSRAQSADSHRGRAGFGGDFKCENEGCRRQGLLSTCGSTDEERLQRAGEASSPPLPYWHIAAAAARNVQEVKYNKQRATEAWDKFFRSAGPQRDVRSRYTKDVKKTKCGNSERDLATARDPRKSEKDLATARDPRMDGTPCRSDRKVIGAPAVQTPLPSTATSGPSAAQDRRQPRRYSMGDECYGNIREAMCCPYKGGGAMNKADGQSGTMCEIKLPRSGGDRAVDMPSYNRSSRKRNQSAPAKICRPFYGSTELEKCSLNAINHLLKAEKELRKVQFTAGAVIPKAQEYVEQVSTIHTDLKQINTIFRDLQKQTNEVLERKGARYFHFMIQGSPTKYKATAAQPPPH
ncbi:hypothetical protein RB195_012705 [Necator americanus]|uniref:Uncharacterized protein n=1 Tax=Necator americanus TaxID=51031 RepID=A0ABR1DTD4_NECAM